MYTRYMPGLRPGWCVFGKVNDEGIRIFETKIDHLKDVQNMHNHPWFEGGTT